MGWSLSRKPEGPFALTADLKAAARERFGIDPETAEHLLYVQRGSKLPWNSDPTLVRVFDPRLMEPEAVVEGFDDVPSSSNTLVLEGAIDKDGNMELADKRVAQA
ncbi:MAG: hypothetical protein ACOC5M_01135 [Chloroflexota bacterium]